MTDTDTDKSTAAEGSDGADSTTDASTEAAGTQDATDFKAEAEKWKVLSRKHEAQAKQNAAAAKRLQELEDASKTDLEKIQGAAAEATKRADAAEAKATRYEVALEKGVPSKLMKFLTGATREEMEASADELLEAIKPADTDGNTGKPKEKLRSGAASEDSGEQKSTADVVAAIPRAI